MMAASVIPDPPLESERWDFRGCWLDGVEPRSLIAMRRTSSSDWQAGRWRVGGWATGGKGLQSAGWLSWAIGQLCTTTLDAAAADRQFWLQQHATACVLSARQPQCASHCSALQCMGELVAGGLHLASWLPHGEMSLRRCLTCEKFSATSATTHGHL